jgi:pimeloyl-ACP methyl ester carboxylesterase
MTRRDTVLDREPSLATAPDIPGPPPGVLFDVGGHRLHLLSMGEQHDGPTVVLETGATGYSGAWAWIQPAVASFARVVSYDRAGLGWSAASTRPHDGLEIGRQLHSLLQSAGVPGPYVLVGHSLGGMFVRLFAHQYPEDVVGMVLVDAAHPDQTERYPRYRELISKSQRFFSSRPWENRRLVQLVAADTSDGMPERQAAEIRAFFSSPRYLTATAAEILAFDTTAAQVRRTRPLGDLPLAVVTAGVGAAEWPGWADLQAELAALSSRSTRQTVAGAAHLNLVTHEQFARSVTEAIRALVEDVRAQR